MDWFRRESNSLSGGPWEAVRQQEGPQESEEALKALEEYDYQIALALSQSANDANLALARQDAENLANVTKRSLTPALTGGSGQADALSFKLWDSDW